MLHNRTWSGSLLDVSIQVESTVIPRSRMVVNSIWMLNLCSVGGPGVMGVVDTTSITQIIEWGKLATFVGFDTRISYRSKVPTLGSCKSNRILPCSRFPWLLVS